MALIPRLGFVAFSLAQPYLIKSMLNYITNHSQLPEYYGYGLIGAYAIVYTGMGVSRVYNQPQSSPKRPQVVSHVVSHISSSANAYGCKWRFAP